MGDDEQHFCRPWEVLWANEGETTNDGWDDAGRREEKRTETAVWDGELAFESFWAVRRKAVFSFIHTRDGCV
jgi:hypothetical protein